VTHAIELAAGVPSLEAFAPGRRSDRRRQLVGWTGVRLQNLCPWSPKRSEAPTRRLDGLSFVREALTSGPKPEGSPDTAPGHGTRALALPPNPKNLGGCARVVQTGCPPCSPHMTADRSQWRRVARPMNGCPPSSPHMTADRSRWPRVARPMNGCPPCSPHMTADRSQWPRVARPMNGLPTLFAAHDRRPKSLAARGASGERVSALDKRTVLRSIRHSRRRCSHRRRVKPDSSPRRARLASSPCKQVVSAASRRMERRSSLQKKP